MFEIIEFIQNNIGMVHFIMSISLTALSCFGIGYMFGSLSSVVNDLKCLDYDRIKTENYELKRAIEIKERNKNHGGKRKSR